MHHAQDLDTLKNAIEQAEHGNTGAIVYCSTCNQKLRITPDRMGKTLRCPTCRSMFETRPPSKAARFIAEHYDHIVLWIIILGSLIGISWLAFYLTWWMTGVTVAACIAATWGVHRLFCVITGEGD